MTSHYCRSYSLLRGWGEGGGGGGGGGGGVEVCEGGLAELAGVAVSEGGLSKCEPHTI